MPFSVAPSFPKKKKQIDNNKLHNGYFHNLIKPDMSSDTRCGKRLSAPSTRDTWNFGVKISNGCGSLSSDQSSTRSSVNSRITDITEWFEIWKKEISVDFWTITILNAIFIFFALIFSAILSSKALFCLIFSVNSIAARSTTIKTHTNAPLTYLQIIKL